MKKLILSFFIISIALSCVKDKFDGKSEETTMPAVDQKYILTTTFTVPVTPGLVTVVTYNGDTLAVTDVAMTINIPKGADQTKASGLQITYEDYGSLPTYVPSSGLQKEEYALLFEDNLQGDYDYNDFVAYVNIDFLSVKGTRYAIVRVKPIALGGVYSLEFGYYDAAGNQILLSNDVRRDYFGGKSGFINTNEGSAPIYPMETINHSDDSEEGWYTYSPSKEAFNNYQSGSYLICKNYIRSGFHKSDIGTWKKLDWIQLIEENDINQNYGYYKYINEIDKTSNQDISFFIKVNGTYIYRVASVNKKIQYNGIALPYGLAIPLKGYNYDSNICVWHTYERANINLLYPQFNDWVNQLAGSNYWYTYKNTNYLYPLEHSNIYRWIGETDI